MEKQDSKQKNNKEKQDSNKKNCSGFVIPTLALSITGVVLLITVFIAIYSMICGQNNPDFKDITVKTLIPLWGTWIGTVLAFYFGKDNFDAASKTYKETIDKLTAKEKMEEIFVKNCMIPLYDIEYSIYDEIRPKHICDILSEKEENRFVILEKELVAKYVIHRSMLDRFLALEVAKGTSTEKIQELTFEDFENCEDKTIKNVLENSFSVIPINSNLLKAKEAVDNDGCSDIFISETGSKKEKVKGWITNIMILKEAEVLF